MKDRQNGNWRERNDISQVRVSLMGEDVKMMQGSSLHTDGDVNVMEN